MTTTSAPFPLAAITDRTADLRPATPFQRFKKMAIMIFGTAVVGGIAWAVGWAFDLGWLQITGYVIAALGAAIGVFTGVTAKVGDCPYCNTTVGGTSVQNISASDENEQVECGGCYEWLVSHQGALRAFTHEDAANAKKLHAPVFKKVAWPAACICCGAPATRTEKAKTAKVEASRLLLGQLSVASASLDGIPYCDQHGGAVTITIIDEAPRLVLDSLDMRRAYVAMNRDQRPITG